jgi:hypothetical protein
MDAPKQSFKNTPAYVVTAVSYAHKKVYEIDNWSHCYKTFFASSQTKNLNKLECWVWQAFPILGAVL